MLIEDDEIDTPEYYDLYEDLNERLCEENRAPKEDKVCCSEDDIKVGSFSSIIKTISSPIMYEEVDSIMCR